MIKIVAGRIRGLSSQRELRLRNSRILRTLLSAAGHEYFTAGQARQCMFHHRRWYGLLEFTLTPVRAALQGRLHNRRAVIPVALTKMINDLVCHRRKSIGRVPLYKRRGRWNFTVWVPVR